MRARLGSRTAPLGLRGRVTGRVAVKTVPDTRLVAGDRLPAGACPAPPRRRAPRWTKRETENAGIPKPWEFRRCTGRLNATQPEIIGRQHSVHTRNGPLVQGCVVCWFLSLCFVFLSFWFVFFCCF